MSTSHVNIPHNVTEPSWNQHDCSSIGQIPARYGMVTGPGSSKFIKQERNLDDKNVLCLEYRFRYWLPCINKRLENLESIRFFWRQIPIFDLE